MLVVDILRVNHHSNYSAQLLPKKNWRQSWLLAHLHKEMLVVGILWVNHGSHRQWF